MSALALTNNPVVSLHRNIYRVHHIHGIIPIPTHLIGRIINIDTGILDKRLYSDLKSLKKVSTFLIEPLRPESAGAWLTYMLKDKSSADYH